MASTKCPKCGELIDVTHAFCPYCGAKASNIHKAAAGLETLVTLGEAVHKHGPIQIDDTNITELCRQFKDDCRDRDLWEWTHEVMAGDSNLMIIIGCDYVEGKKYLRRKDVDQGKKWFRLAMKHGDPDGSKLLEMCENGLHDEDESACFISTAVYSTFSNSDDCHELITLRRLRDTYMQATPGRQAEVREYYRMAPAIVLAINNQPEAEAIWRQIAEEYVLPCVQLAEANKPAEAHHLYRRMVLELKEEYWSKSRAESQG